MLKTTVPSGNEQLNMENGIGAPGQSGSELFNGLEETDTPETEKKALDLSVKLSEDERLQLSRRIKNDITSYITSTGGRRGNVQAWRRDFELFPTGRSNRWPGSSDVPAPLTHIYVNNHHSRLNQQIVKAVPPFTAVAKTVEALEVSGDIEEAMTSRLEDADWEEIADQIHLELPLVGNVGLRVTYEHETNHVPRHQFNIDLDTYKLLLETGTVNAVDAAWEAMEKDEEGNPKVIFSHEDEPGYSGVKFQVIPWEDFIILPATIRDPKKAYGIGERLMIRGYDLRQGAEDGTYIKEAVEKVLEKRQGAQPSDRTERLDVQGLTYYTNSSSFDADYEDYLCYELCWQMDANKDGKMEWVLITMHWDSGEILRCSYLPYEHGEPTYHLFRYFPRVKELFGMAVSEKLATYQDAATAVINQIIDHADLNLNLFGNIIYDQTSGYDPAKQKHQLGKPIRVDNIDGIKPLQVAPMPAEHYNVYQLFKEIGDLITSTSNPSLGKVSESSKTLGEVQLVAAASGMQFEEVASRVARTWANVFDQVRKLEAQYAQDGVVNFRRKVAPAGDIIGQIPREMLLEQVKLVPTGLKQLADMQSRVQQATIVQNTLLQHPLTTGDPLVMVETLDVYLQSVNYPKREKIMEIVYQKVNAMMQQQAALAQAGIDPTQQNLEGQEGGSPPEAPKDAAVPKESKAERILQGNVNGPGNPTQPPI